MPQPRGPVWCLAPSDSVLYVGGLFGSIGGQERHRVAAIRLTDGGATEWDPSADDAVTTLAVGSGAIYAGGLFGRIGGQVRSRIAALDPATGSATTWDPAVHSWGWVNGLAVGGHTVYVGGRFTSVGGETRNNLAAVDAVTDSVLPWRADADGEVETVATSGGAVFAGGLFRSVGGLRRSGLVALNGTTGSVSDWNPMTDADVWAMAPSDGTLDVGGNFGSVGLNPALNFAAIPMPDAAIEQPPPGLPPGITVLLAPIAPNPVTSDATVRFRLLSPASVSIAFYDVQGRRLAETSDSRLRPAGDYEAHVSTVGWPLGTYFCRVECGGRSATRKLLVVR